jgi:hypothetical protein
VTTTPSVSIDPVRAGPGERVVEFASGDQSDAHRKGGLISLRNNDDGTLAVNVHRCDPGVVVTVEGQYHHIPTETTLGEYALLSNRLRRVACVAAYNEFLAARRRAAGYFAVEAALMLLERYPGASRALFRIEPTPGAPDTLRVDRLVVYDATGTQIQEPESALDGENTDALDIANMLAAAAEFGDPRYFRPASKEDGAPAALDLGELFARPVYPEAGIVP